MSSELEALSAQLLSQLPIGIIIWHLDDPADDESLRLVFANPVASKMTERDLDSYVGRPMREAFPAIKPERTRFYAEICRARTRREIGEVAYDTEISSSTFDVTAIPALERGVMLVIENRSILKRAEADAKQLTRFLDSIIEHLPAMVFVKEAQSLRFERFNRAGEELLGLSRQSLIGKNDYDFFPKEQADFFTAKDRKVIANRTLEDIPEEPIDTPTGTRWLHTRKIPLFTDAGEAMYLLGVSIDITERKRAEELLRKSHDELERRVAERTAELERQISERERAEQALAQTEEELRQSQRLEAVGQLAGGVAHDFNNILSVVLGYCESVTRQLHPSDRLREEMKEIEQAAEKAAALTNQLLAFSRQQVLQPRVIVLNDVVRGMERMLGRMLGEDIKLHIRTAPGLASVKADPGQIEQVVMNLVVNARDAMPTGGRLTVETANVDLDAAYAAEHPEATAGPHVMIAVSDTGVGMDRETMSRVFEPFFTTKERGKGTGLGLSTAFGIIKQSGGSIWVYSEPGRGTTFKVYFPVSQERAGAARREDAPASDRHGSETILLVEDDDQLRTLVSSQLRRFGYRTISCGSAAEALEIGESESVDLLLTDVVMPDMGGRVLAEQFALTNPNTRVLYMSGYTDDAVVRHGVLESSVAFLQKPFTPDVLAKRVRETLAS